MTQTETVTRQALEERVTPVLYINKIDRLIKELRLGPEQMQKWLFNIVNDFNRLIDTYAEPRVQGEVEGRRSRTGQVAFGSSKDKWGFNSDMAKAARACRSRTSSRPTTATDAGGAGQEAPAPRGAPRHGRQAPPTARRSAGLPHPQDLAGRPQQRGGQVPAGVRRERPDGHDGHQRRGRPRGGAGRRRQALLGLSLQRRRVYLLNSKKQGKIQSVQIFMGFQREIVDSLPAGNIPALLGLDIRSGETHIHAQGRRARSSPSTTSASRS